MCVRTWLTWIMAWERAEREAKEKGQGKGKKGEGKGERERKRKESQRQWKRRSDGGSSSPVRRWFTR